MITILTRAWLLLIALSFATTVFAGVLPEAGPVFVTSVLFLAGLKSRIILSDYLGLRDAPTFKRGFTMILIGFLGLALLLYALPFGM
ncbi:cytochrome C oxidase subunit IV family protein [uncultured Shimia sp.]|uniref:cytochrome C oxidase subunit IV family protein n=1 Tax=uncultured Shimia sp. TaxID=573152 RepID=UPI00262EFDB4|nr:cytochrome C oxidase subunit IV family protein [uncultured Shimia sp.]